MLPKKTLPNITYVVCFFEKENGHKVHFLKGKWEDLEGFGEGGKVHLIHFLGED